MPLRKDCDFLSAWVVQPKQTVNYNSVCHICEANRGISLGEYLGRHVTVGEYPLVIDRGLDGVKRLSPHFCKDVKAHRELPRIHFNIVSC
jgi:hypothetical protein